ncbi:nitroreductase family protein [Dictyobacter kobayashii]|uniref:Putative NAD(P)H nitroreductase n=1 Tax=Dictyobacter kobayashii TaxID=2014872 RepID=A0A402AFC1_9CHLR|nr:nitroreductase [Dictyobacter kobayashii]GCE17786.1 nitroreductase [Dictyobacter kobayashii]
MTTVFETIKRRRSIGKMTDQVPTREQIEQILEAATHAPNHHKTEPWKFFVLGDKARVELGEVMAQALAERHKDNPHLCSQASLDKERHKPLRSPILIAVAAEAPEQDRVLATENIEATAAAVQNMLLTAEELGLAAVWRTGEASYDPQVKRWFGLTPDEQLIAFLYLGYPAIQPTERQPLPVESKTTWLF